MKTGHNPFLLIPVMTAFFVMGFVDVIGIATNYLKADFRLSDSIANLFPFTVFLWFFLLAVPASLLTNKIGCRKTVLLSVAITAAALLVPCTSYSLGTMLVSFSLLGIGNTLLQVALNPLLAHIVNGDKLAGSLTLGQFMKAMASFSGPVIAGWMAVKFGNWLYLYPCFFIVASVAAAGLATVSIKERKEEKKSSFTECLSLLADPIILVFFSGIVCHVGMDVGINTLLPRLLMERTGIELSEAGYAVSVYFLFRTAGCFTGAFILAHCSGKKFFQISLVCLLSGLAGLLFFSDTTFLYASIALSGLGNATLFSILFSQALLHKPAQKNEISGLMIMGISGGAVFPLFMGGLSDLSGSQASAVWLLIGGVLYLGYTATKMRV